MLRSVVICGYEIVMEDEQYNNLLNRAKAQMDKSKKKGITGYSFDDYVVQIFYKDIGEYFRPMKFLFGEDF